MVSESKKKFNSFICFIVWLIDFNGMSIAQSAGAVEYADCFSAEG